MSATIEPNIAEAARRAAFAQLDEMRDKVEKDLAEGWIRVQYEAEDIAVGAGEWYLTTYLRLDGLVPEHFIPDAIACARCAESVVTDDYLVRKIKVDELGKITHAHGSLFCHHCETTMAVNFTNGNWETA